MTLRHNKEERQFTLQALSRATSSRWRFAPGASRRRAIIIRGDGQLLLFWRPGFLWLRAVPVVYHLGRQDGVENESSNESIQD